MPITPPALHVPPTGGGGVAPVYSSVSAVAPPALPPKPNPADCVPAPPRLYRAVPILPPAVQAVPSYSSVTAVTPGTPSYPPNARPADCVPPPAK